MYDFDRVLERRGTNSAKWDFSFFVQPEADGDTIPMWVADMDFACAPEIIGAIRERLDRSPVLGYSSYICPRYFRAVCGWYQRRYGWYIHSDSVVVTKGVVPAMKSLILALTGPGDGVIINMPVYYPFFNTILATGRTVVNSPLAERDGYYTLDFADLEEKLSRPENKLLLFCNPHNPTGRVWSREELARLGELCKRHGVILVSDEIHGDLTRLGCSYTPVAALFPGEEFIITCTAPSKTFNLAGMGLSNIVVPSAEHRRALEGIDGVPQLANPLSIAATQAAYESGDAWVDELRAYLDGSMELLAEFLKERLPRARFRVPEGLYLAWVDVSAYRSDGPALERELVERGKILLECGERFGAGGGGFIRINCACPRSLLLEGLARIAGCLEGGAEIHPLPRSAADERLRPVRPPAVGEECVACGACAAACPEHAISPADPRVTDPQRCALCLRCISACPTLARRADTLS